MSAQVSSRNLRTAASSSLEIRLCRSSCAEIRASVTPGRGGAAPRGEPVRRARGPARAGDAGRTWSADRRVSTDWDQPGLGVPAHRRVRPRRGGDRRGPPLGGPDRWHDPGSPDVAWSVAVARDRWTALTVRVTATAATLTVFLEASGDAGERGATESVWFDDVALLAVQPFCPPETEPPRWIRSWWRGWRRRPARRACRCGSVAERRTTCGAANCRCRTDPTQRHGPYFEYTRKVAGKTTGRRLTSRTGRAVPVLDRQPPRSRPDHRSHGRTFAPSRPTAYEPPADRPSGRRR